jgi:hypothetical protein
MYIISPSRLYILLASRPARAPSSAFCIDHDGIESKLTSGVARKIQGTKGEEIVNNA